MAKIQIYVKLPMNDCRKVDIIESDPVWSHDIRRGREVPISPIVHGVEFVENFCCHLVGCKSGDGLIPQDWLQKACCNINALSNRSYWVVHLVYSWLVVFPSEPSSHKRTRPPCLGSLHPGYIQKWFVATPRIFLEAEQKVTCSYK